MMKDKLKITILYDDDEIVALDAANPLHDLKYVTDIQECLTHHGHDVTVFNVTSKTVHLLKDIKTDLFFNLLESFSDLPMSVYPIVSYIESLNIPMTGSSALTLFITTDKARTKDFLVKNGIPTAKYQLFLNENSELDASLNFPLIVKPNFSDASEGISQDSVVENEKDLRERVRSIREELKSASIVEEFIEGREYEVFSLMVDGEIRILPVAEEHFNKVEGRKWSMQDFNSKWDRSETGVVQICPAEISETVLTKIHEIVHKAYEVFDISGYCRVDFRVSKDGTPYVIEVNTNPDLEIWEDGNVPYAKAANIDYKDFIQMIAESAFDVEPEVSVKARPTSTKKKSS